MKSSFVAAMSAAGTALAQDGTFSNPIIYQDLADIDIIRVNDTFYYSASTMHYSPGAPILRSYDLVNWEYAGHSVPELAFGEEYDLEDSSAYVKGIWASSIGYRESNGLYYWYGCIDFSQTHIFTAEDPAGPWTQHEPMPECYYDLGLLIDDDDTMYLAYGRYDIGVVQLAEDGLSAVEDQLIWEDTERYLEGARFYNINGNYYIWLTKPADEQHVLKADNPWGPYEEHSVLERMTAPIPYSGTPHQGGIVDTPNGDWYYMGFLDAYPAGRIPVLAPLTWDEDGWPHIVTDENGGWGASYPMPDIQTDKTVNAAGPYTDSFDGDSLGNQWEWNHNPQNDAWSLGADGLTLTTASVTDDLHHARNTLTHRILGPKSSATFRLNVGGLTAGDVAGVTLIRDETAWLGVRKGADGGLQLEYAEGLTIVEGDNGWQSTSNGTVEATADEGALGEAIEDGSEDLWLRITADITANFNNPNAENLATFEYSTDGEEFVQLGPDYAMHNRWEFFKAFRFGVFNYATQALGGSITVKQFDLQAEE